jgi:hypothetical protein
MLTREQGAYHDDGSRSVVHLDEAAQPVSSRKINSTGI